MSSSLLSQPDGATHPTAVLTSFPSSALFARFDPTGRLVAAGRPDGILVVWALDVQEAVRVFEVHVKALTSVSWSRNARFLLASSKDWNITVWDLAADQDPPQPHALIRFDAPVHAAAFHPRNSQIILALLEPGEVYVVDLRKHFRGRTELVEVVEDTDGMEDGEGIARMIPGMTAASFDPTGRYIFVGTTAGTILVFSSRTKYMIARHTIPAAGAIKNLDFAAANGRTRMFTNSADRVLREFVLPAVYAPPAADGLPRDVELEPLHRYLDPINRTAWAGLALSRGGGLLASADMTLHKIHIWETRDGRFVTTLDGGREALADVHWHPSKPSIASTTKHGNILIWHAPTPERWGAFAGGFEEVDENVWYEEREDEFDFQDEDELARKKAQAEEQDVDIDSLDAPVDLEPEVDDEETQWAEEEPDGDNVGWRMKVWMEEEEVY